MTFHANEMTIEELLSDPLFRAANRADRVDAADFERLLRSTAAARPDALAEPGRAAGSRRSAILACLCASQAKRGDGGLSRSW